MKRRNNGGNTMYKVINIAEGYESDAFTFNRCLHLMMNLLGGNATVKQAIDAGYKLVRQ